MATTTQLTAFNDGVNNLVSSVLIYLSEWLKNNKSVNVTVEELHDALKLPMTRSIIAPNLMPIPGMNVPVTPTVSKGKGKRTQAPKDGPKCTYEKIRGAKGLCSNTAHKDEKHGIYLPYCKACMGKKNVEPKLKEFYREHGIQYESAAAPEKKATASKAVSNEQDADDDSLSIDVLPMDHPEGYNVSQPDLLVIKKTADDTLIAVAAQHKDRNEYHKLTAENKQKATSLKLIVGSDADYDEFIKELNKPCKIMSKKIPSQ